jgi:hypothetical protein
MDPNHCPDCGLDMPPGGASCMNCSAPLRLRVAGAPVFFPLFRVAARAELSVGSPEPTIPAAPPVVIPAAPVRMATRVPTRVPPAPAAALARPDLQLRAVGALLLVLGAVGVALALRVPLPAKGGGLLPREGMFGTDSVAGILHGLQIVLGIPALGLLALRPAAPIDAATARWRRIGLALAVALLVWYAPIHVMSELRSYQLRSFLSAFLISAGVCLALSIAWFVRARRRPEGWTAWSFDRGTALTAAGILWATLIASLAASQPTEVLDILLPRYPLWSTTLSAIAFNASAGGIVFGTYAMYRKRSASSEPVDWARLPSRFTAAAVVGAAVGWADHWIPLVEFGRAMNEGPPLSLEVSGSLCLPVSLRISGAALLLAVGHVLWVHRVLIPRAGLPLVLALWMPLVGIMAGPLNMALWCALTVAGNHLHKRFGIVPVLGLRLAVLLTAVLDLNTWGAP